MAENEESESLNRAIGLSSSSVAIAGTKIAPAQLIVFSIVEPRIIELPVGGLSTMDDLWNSLQREAAVISLRSNADVKLTLGFNHRANRRSSKQLTQSADRFVFLFHFVLRHPTPPPPPTPYPFPSLILR
ncbi:unnamed protein product [Toxocara canis]|uniref:Proteasome assembly chaperone 3 n=1 Tax=Toxocara canis TaxID=6265 RepID=A0A183U038_TOXCA|nr:unnamed protein product [Toxocara canis]